MSFCIQPIFRLKYLCVFWISQCFFRWFWHYFSLNNVLQKSAFYLVSGCEGRLAWWFLRVKVYFFCANMCVLLRTLVRICEHLRMPIVHDWFESGLVSSAGATSSEWGCDHPRSTGLWLLCFGLMDSIREKALQFILYLEGWGSGRWSNYLKLVMLVKQWS